MDKNCSKLRVVAKTAGHEKHKMTISAPTLHPHFLTVRFSKIVKKRGKKKEISKLGQKRGVKWGFFSKKVVKIGGFLL